MKEGWEYRRMDEVCSIARGGSPRPIKDYITNDPNGLNWIKIGDTDMGGKYIYSTKEKIKPEGLKKSRWVEEDEFLLSNSMSFGRPYILKTNGCIHDGWLVLRDYQKYLNIDFFYYVLSSENVQRQFRIKAQGSTVSNLNTDRVASVTIPIPPLSEQQSIVDYLDLAYAKIDAMKANAEKRLNEAKALFQASLKKMLEPKEGWEEMRLSELVNIINGYAFPSKAFGDNQDLKVVKITNVGVGSFIEDNSTLPQKMYIQEVSLKEGDIVIALTRTIISDGLKRAIIPTSYDGAMLNQRVASLRYNGKINMSFLYYYLGCSIVSDYVLLHVNTLMQPNLSIKDLKDLPVCAPPLSNQQSIVATLDSLKSKVDRLQENFDKISKECDALKQAILRDIFE